MEQAAGIPPVWMPAPRAVQAMSTKLRQTGVPASSPVAAAALGDSGCVVSCSVENRRQQGAPRGQAKGFDNAVVVSAVAKIAVAPAPLGGIGRAHAGQAEIEPILAMQRRLSAIEQTGRRRVHQRKLRALLAGGEPGARRLEPRAIGGQGRAIAAPSPRLARRARARRRSPARRPCRPARCRRPGRSPRPPRPAGRGPQPCRRDRAASARNPSRSGPATGTPRHPPASNSGSASKPRRSAAHSDRRRPP